jgi:NADPH-dependent ferric siderophore reductase
MTSLLARLIRPSKATAYRIFDIELQAIVALSPRCAASSSAALDVAQMTTLAPTSASSCSSHPAGAAPSLPKDGQWQQARRHLAPQDTPPMRTYTIALRREACEGMWTSSCMG